MQGEDDQREKTARHIRKKRRRAFFKGHWAEGIACLFLMTKGYRICARRFKTRAGEVDIIARKKDLLAIVEVKARNSVEEAVNSVSWQSQRRIANAADFWLSRQKDAHLYSMRFDIVAIVPWALPVHIKDAF